MNELVRLVPSHGCYQPTKDGILCKETRTEWHARAVDSQHVIRFRKSTMLPVLDMDRKFPCYRLVMPNAPRQTAERSGASLDAVVGASAPKGDDRETTSK